MNKIFFIADLFFDEGFYGGAERCNDVLIKEFFNVKFNDYKNNMFVTIACSKLKPQIIEKNLNSTFFICNFMSLSEECKKTFTNKKIDYIIVEHDHKYVKSNNPGIYPNMLSNEEGLQNTEFYKNARAVLCQSAYACEVFFKNIALNNLVNLGGNLWSKNDLNLLKQTLKTARSTGERDPRWAVLNTNNENKGTPETVEYCLKNKLPYQLIGDSNYQQFLKQISNHSGIAFFPRWVETFNRFLVEARALGCKIMTNNRVGCVEDNWMNYKGQELINQMELMKPRIFKVYDDLVNKREVEMFKVNLPRVTIMTTFAEAEDYVEDWLQTVTNQTIFDEVDVIIYDAGSVGVESEIVLKYCSLFPNIKYIKNDKRIGSSKAFNIMINESPNEYIGMISIDDRPSPEYTEKLRKYLHFSEVDLVYGDCIQSYEKNAPIDESFYKSTNYYEHSLKDFSQQNMIKSLPGPMPMFRKSMIEKNGGFDTSFKHSNDWELWLRCVRSGAKFYKVHSRIGLYYFNPDGVTTSANIFKSKIQEEAKLFFEYRDVIGDENFNKYKQYFSQGLINDK